MGAPIRGTRAFRRYPFDGLHGCPSECLVSVIATKLLCPQYLVLLSETASNPGTSVTNAIEKIATGIYLDLFKPKRVAPEDIAWVEHYGPQSYRSGLRERTLDAAHLEWGEDPYSGGTRYRHPVWRPFDLVFGQPEHASIRAAVFAAAFTVEQSRTPS